MSERYALRSLDEAQAYLAHPSWTRAWRERGLVLALGAQTAEDVSGRSTPGSCAPA